MQGIDGTKEKAHCNFSEWQGQPWLMSDFLWKAQKVCENNHWKEPQADHKQRPGGIHSVPGLQRTSERAGPAAQEQSVNPEEDRCRSQRRLAELIAVGGLEERLRSPTGGVDVVCNRAGNGLPRGKNRGEENRWQAITNISDKNRSTLVSTAGQMVKFYNKLNWAK